MAIFVDETKRVLVQGITGREGQARTRLMRGLGSSIYPRNARPIQPLHNRVVRESK